MKLTFTLVETTSAPPHARDVQVCAPEPVPFGRARDTLLRLALPHLTAPAGEPARGVEVRVDGGLVRDEDLLGVPPLVSGAVLQLGPAQPSSTAPAHPTRRPPALARLVVTGGRDAGSAVALPRGRHLLGRGAGCQVRLSDPGVSRTQVAIDVDPSGVSVQEIAGANPAQLDAAGLGPSPRPLRAESVLRVAGTTLTVRVGDARRAMTTLSDGSVLVHRGPRPRRAAVGEAVVFPEAPRSEESRARIPLLAAMVPLVLSGVLAYVMRSPLMLVFALMTPVLVLGQWWSDRRHNRTSSRRAQRAYRRAVDAAHTLLLARARDDVAAWRDALPDLARLSDAVEHADERLWERCPDDDDWCAVRVGAATLPTRVEVTGCPEEFADARLVPDAPLRLDLRAAGVTGLAGPGPARRSLAGAVVAHLLAWHPPQLLRLIVLAEDVEARRAWQWALRTPHSDSRSDTDATLESLQAELTRRQQSRDEVRLAGRAGQPRPPVIAVVVDGSLALGASPALRRLLREGPLDGIVLVCLEERVEALPGEVSATLCVGRDGAASLTDSNGTTRFWADLPSAAWLDRTGRAMAPLVDAALDAADGRVPAGTTLQEVHERDADAFDPCDADAIVAQWGTSRLGLPASVGMGANGTRQIDLVADGPHALVGGTTGSGKSQFLRTWVAAIALRCSPERVNFVLVDYKGGSAFTECASLPHTVAVVSDLDEHLTTRALTSLQAEVKRRERMLAEIGAADLPAYERLRGARPGLPRLVIVVDEFKMLADELPDFVSGLVRLAAVGRSLGLHLILATQRPGGIVTGDMRANIALRVALRVRDQSDSRDVIEEPDAAAISASTPGRALVRDAGGELYELQTADTAALVRTQGSEPAVTVREIVWGGEPLARPTSEATTTAVPGTAVPGTSSSSAAGSDVTRPSVGSIGPSQLAAAVQAMRTAASRLGLAPPRSPWLPALPERVELPLPPAPRVGPLEAPGAAGAMAASAAGAMAAPAAGAVAVGLVDQPALQRQEPWTWDLVAGGHLGVGGSSRTGRTTALRVAVLACAAHHSPEALHVHILTPRPQEWSGLLALPHLGTVCGTDDAFAAARVIERLLREDAPPGLLRLVVVDGWESVERSLERVAFDDAARDPRTLLTDGLGRGIRVVVSGERAVLSGGVSAMVGTRVALSLNDPTDLMLAGVPASSAPSSRAPGRAVDLRTHDELQVFAHDDANGGATVARLVSRWPDPARRPWRHRPLPSTVALADLGPADPGGDAVARGADIVAPGAGPAGGWVLGVGGDEATVVGILPGADCCRVVVSGPRGSGRSTALAGLLTQAVAERRPCAVVARRRSVLTELAGQHAVPVLDPASPDDVRTYIALRTAHPALVVLVDDAGISAGAALEPALLETAERAAASGGFVAASLDAERDGTGSALVRRLTQDGCGIVLWPGRHDRGDLLGVRPDPTELRIPGRGAFIESGRSTTIQVATPPPPPPRPKP